MARLGRAAGSPQHCMRKASSNEPHAQGADIARQSATAGLVGNAALVDFARHL